MSSSLNNETPKTPTQKQRTKCEVWTRVMGYHRPVSQFNKGKKSEFYSRVYYKEEHPSTAFMKKYASTHKPAAVCLK